MRHTRRNRRRPDYLKRAVWLTGFALAIELAAVALFSPRLNVTGVQIEGAKAVSDAVVLRRVGHVRGRNIVQMSTRAIARSVALEPTIASASVSRSLPSTLVVHVVERVPALAVRASDGVWYTVDKDWVAFRAGQAPEAGLLPVVVETPGSAPVFLGKPMRIDERESIETCLSWAQRHQDFPVEWVGVAPDGKLCLNRKGDLPVNLGDGVDLARKLDTLSQLIAHRPDLRNSADIAYVNVLASDRPALMMRTAALPPPDQRPARP